MPFMEESSPFTLTSSSHELRYNRQHKKLALVPIRTGPYVPPGREIREANIAGSVTMLVWTIYHDLSVYYSTSNPPSDDEVASVRHTIWALAKRVENWLVNDGSGMVEIVTDWFRPGTTPDTDPLAYLHELVKRASSAVWQFFLPFLCDTHGPDWSSEEPVLRMFVTLHLQSMAQALLSAGPGRDPFRLPELELEEVMSEPMWIQISAVLDGLDTFYSGYNSTTAYTRRHKEIVAETIGAVRSLGLIDHFTDGVAPTVIWVALVKAVETDNRPADDEEVLALTELFLCVAVFDIGRRPDQAAAMMGCYTQSVIHPEVKAVIRRRARHYPAWTVPEPFRSRLELLSQ